MNYTNPQGWCLTSNTGEPFQLGIFECEFAARRRVPSGKAIRTNG
jgi:hypothetical protein